MTAERWRRIEELFELVADLPQGIQEEQLRQACAGDGLLFEKVLALLNHDRSRGGKIGEVIEGLSRIPAPEELSFTGRRLGAYRVVRELGRGGMGIVFEAMRDDDTYNKRVALKVAARAAYSHDFLQRFRHERQILARLEHPHIARLLDGGTTEEGIPFFVMEYVEGVPIHQYAADQKLSIPARIHLFLQVCDAVEYAHQNLVIHRDLKPGNILVSGGSVRLLDFGIAKLADQTDAESTGAGLMAATPDYCSPEQVRGQPVTTRTDVYSLGLVLHELLTGERAQQADTSSPQALDRSICETSARPPSACALARGDRALARLLRGDLDAMVFTATRKEPASRYASAAALAEDLRRHLEGKPIRARQDNRWYRAARFARRHWMPLAAAAVLVTTLVAGILAASFQARRAERRFQQVRRIAGALMVDVHKAIRDLPASTKAQEVVVRTAIEYLDALAQEAGNDISLQVETGQGYLQVAQLAYTLSRPSLGRSGEADLYYEKAKAILAPLARAHPGNPRVAAVLTKYFYLKGDFLLDTGHAAEALRFLERAVETAESALSGNAGDIELLDELREAQHYIMANFTSSPAARKLVSRHLEIAEQLAGVRPVTVDRLANLGVAYSQAAKIAATDGNLEEAMQHLRKNVEVQSRAVAMEPQNYSVRRNLMMAWFHIGDERLGPLGPTSYTGSGGPPVEIDPKLRREALEAYRKGAEQSEWIYRHDPENDTVKHDYAVSLGRQAAAYPHGDLAAIPLLEKSLELLRQLEPGHPNSTLSFVIEFRASLAERRRQAGQFDLALAQWKIIDDLVRKAVAADPTSYYIRRLAIPIYWNWALELARRKNREGALALARRAARLAGEVADRQEQYSRAAGWPPRVKTWLAGLHQTLGDRREAARARQESLEMWSAVASRSDLPQDLIGEARRMLARDRK